MAIFCFLPGLVCCRQKEMTIGVVGSIYIVSTPSKWKSIVYEVSFQRLSLQAFFIALEYGDKG